MHRKLVFLPLIAGLVLTNHALATELEWVRTANDQRGFVLAESGRTFVPWGFNYDHDREGRLIEDYWEDEWESVADDFQEMKQLGANVVRVHLQFGKFMTAADAPNQDALRQLEKLLRLAERTGLYLDVTGLGCYHKQNVPAWYDALDEQQRWQAQARFWEAVAARCAKSPALFCYDLMNEPYVPGGKKKRDDWLGPAFAGKHFVQFITLETTGRPRQAIARDWIGKMVAAIRKQDRRHLITVGLVPNSLDRPGLTSGFIPDQVTDDLDFLAVHLYPETGKNPQALKTLQGFAEVGKPVVIEEIFPLKCDAQQLGRFIDASKPYAAGWIGFYWGKTPEEYQPPATIPEGLTLDWLRLFQEKRESILAVESEAPAFLNNGVTAHRGDSGNFPENTLAAFQGGIAAGADWLELDILRTQDGQLVVIHDKTTARVGDRKLVVAESTYKELATVDVATDFRRRTGKSLADCPPQRIPLLEDVLKLVKKQRRTRVSIQPKMDCVAEAVALVKRLQMEAWVGFNDGNLQYMTQAKRLAPAVTIFWDRGANTDIEADIRTAKTHGFAALVINQAGVTAEKVQKIKAASLEAGAWTVNDPQRMAQLRELGVERLYTDYPRRALE
ncbi:Glycerophosphoryl diester phosphodiesterase [Symmachiella dynata]|uniref:Glycerophosphoryl diester phosphodiesterase n=1 Tax=Symmachiella dynata TaxID=2527995 RepID=A0A517ZHS3_9PLAN|nr:glycerophosphodiester phosphodiesterase family protein [Symmachiella dynata]QDU42025.1 Glycerophosphoryl diester phosphodiesterase [Symmachiella dynata]